MNRKRSTISICMDLDIYICHEFFYWWNRCHISILVVCHCCKMYRMFIFVPYQSLNRTNFISHDIYIYMSLVLAMKFHSQYQWHTYIYVMDQKVLRCVGNVKIFIICRKNHAIIAFCIHFRPIFQNLAMTYIYVMVVGM